MDFAGRHVGITGASSSIGRATAERVMKAGARVTLITRRGELPADLCAELGPGAGWASADVGKRHLLIAAIEAAPNGERVNCLLPGFIHMPMLAEGPSDQLGTLAANVPQQRLGTLSIR